MSRQSRWIYRDMLDIYYDTEQPLPLDIEVLCDMLGVESDEDIRLVERLLKFKFEKTEHGYINNTCVRVIAEYHAKADTAKENGKRGGRPKNPKEPSGFQSGFNPVSENNPIDTGSEANQEPITNNQQPITKAKSKDLPPPPALPEKKATRLPKDWVLPKTWGDWALAEYPLCTAGDVREMADSFKDHWIANASRATGKKDDWLATWRNWVRKNHPNKAGVPRQAGTSYHEKLTDTAEQIFGRKHGTGNQIIDITPKQAAGSDQENIPAVYAGLRA